MQQAGAQPVFEIRDGLADGRLGKIQPLGRAAEASRRRSPHESSAIHYVQSAWVGRIAVSGRADNALLHSFPLRQSAASATIRLC